MSNIHFSHSHIYAISKTCLPRKQSWGRLSQAMIIPRIWLCLLLVLIHILVVAASTNTSDRKLLDLIYLISLLNFCSYFTHAKLACSQPLVFWKISLTLYFVLSSKLYLFLNPGSATAFRWCPITISENLSLLLCENSSPS